MDVLAHGCFTTYIYAGQIPDHDSLNAKLIESVKALQAKDPGGQQQTNIKGWQSARNLQELPEFAEVHRHFEAACAQAGKEMKVKQGLKWHYQTWVNLSPSSAFNLPHIHPDSHLSGVYYVRIPEGSGQIYFRDPRVQAKTILLPVEPDSELNVNELTFPPQPGVIYMFPSWLEHGVKPGTTDQDRIAIAFNARLLP